jgi:hypothetical protein
MAKQTAFGSPASSPTHRWLLNGSPSLAVTRNIQRFELTDSSRAPGNSYVASVGVAGDVPLLAHPQGMSILFGGVLGASADSGSTPNYTHTATPSSDTPYFTCWRMVANGIFERFDNVKIDSLSLEGSAGAPIGITLSLIGTSATFLASDPVLDALDDRGYIYYEADSAIDIDAVARTIHSFTFSISNNMSAYQADKLYASSVDPGSLDVSMSFSTRYEGPTSFPKYREWMYGSDAGTTLSSTISTHAADVTWTRDANTSFQVLMPQFTYVEMPIQPDPGGDPLSIDVTAFVEKPTSGEMITVVTKDQRATAYSAEA